MSPLVARTRRWLDGHKLLLWTLALYLLILVIALHLGPVRAQRPLQVFPGSD